MKYSILSLLIFVIFFSIVRADIDTSKSICKDLGFEPGTEKYGDCGELKFDEATYIGEVKNGKAYGIGVINFSDGSKYEGKVKKDRAHGEGKYTDAQGNVFEGKFRRNKFINMMNKKTRNIINIDVNKGIASYFEIRGTGKTSGGWFEADMKYLHQKMLNDNVKINDIDNSEMLLKYVKYVLTLKGKRDMEAANKDDGGGDGGGDC
ncbi:hypothetical protein OAO17_00085 [Candidatus Pelagibacter sp.]|nr:hypothetical protein [Candidatus Pelagibacter sp.]